MMYNTGNVVAVHYAEVCTAFGAVRAAGHFKDKYLIDALAERYDSVLYGGVENTANHVDANVYGILPLELFNQGKDLEWYTQGMLLAEGQWENPLDDGLTRQTRYWIDDVYMIGSLQMQAFRATGNQKYIDKAADEIVAYLKKLQQPNGLFYHGENAPFHWGRGNGWVAAGLAEIISELPKNHKYYKTIVDGYTKMMSALVSHQAEDGMWRQLIDKPESWKETSGTGMFAYALCMGVKKGILSDQIYEDAYQKAWIALVSYLQEDGKISNVCVGTGQSMDIQYYLNRPVVTGDFHGQAPLLWLSWALLQ